VYALIAGIDNRGVTTRAENCFGLSDRQTCPLKRARTPSGCADELKRDGDNEGEPPFDRFARFVHRTLRPRVSCKEDV